MQEVILPPHQEEILKESLLANIRRKIKNLWEAFSTRDRFTKISLVVMTVILLATPFIVAQQTNLFSHAGTSLFNNCTPIPPGLTQQQVQQLLQRGQVRWCNTNQPPLPTSLASIQNSYKNLPQYSFGADTDIRAGGAEWSNPTLINHMQQMHYQTLRFPGGLADEYDWKTGKYDLHFNTNPLQAPNWGYGDTVTTLQQLKDLYDQLHATPLFVLNVVTSGRNTNRPCGSASTWDSDWQAMLDDQITYLQTAQSMGLPIQLVELGNEVYGTTANPSCLFPTGAIYGTLMNHWIDALHATFPNVQVALVGDPTNEGNTWNKDMLTTAKNFDAITLHLYADTTKGFDESGDQCSVQKAEYNSLQSPQGTADFLSGLSWWYGWYNYQISLNFPPTAKLWVTESGPSDTKYGFSSTWADGLYAAGYYMYLLRQPQITEINDFTAVDDGLYAEMFQTLPVPGYQGDRQNCTPFPTVLPYSFSPKGFTLQLIGQSLKGMTQYAPITFSPNPLLHGKNSGGSTDYSLIGEVYTNGTSATAVVLNLSGRTVSLGMQALPNFKSYTQFSSPNPAMLTRGDASATGGANTVTSTSGAITTPRDSIPVIQLSPYSITELNQHPGNVATIPTPSGPLPESTQFQIYVLNQQGKGIDGVKIDVSDNGNSPVLYTSKNGGQVLLTTIIGHTITATLSLPVPSGYTPSDQSIFTTVFPYTDITKKGCGQADNSCLFHLINASIPTGSPTPTPPTDTTQFQIYILDPQGNGIDGEQVTITDTRSGIVLSQKTYTSHNGGAIVVPTSVGDYIDADAIGPYAVTSSHIGAIVYSYTDTSSASCGESNNSCLFHLKTAPNQ